jgi:ABC-2 type transport system permease protein
MTRYLNLYGLFLIQRLKILMEYRLNFFIGSISTIFMQGAGIATVGIVMSRIPSLNGWSLAQVMLIYGLLTLAKAINHMFADNLWTIGRAYIRTGGFDRFLVRPIDPLFHLLADRFCHDGIGDVLIGAALVIAASLQLGIVWTPFNLAYTVVSVLSGGVIFIALNLLTCVSSFWIMDSVPVTRVVFDNHLFAQFPITIYPKALQVWLTWLVPYAFCSFYPASQLMGKEIGVYAWLAPVIAAVLIVAAYRVWQFGLRHYGSTGS